MLQRVLRLRLPVYRRAVGLTGHAICSRSFTLSGRAGAAAAIAGSDTSMLGGLRKRNEAPSHDPKSKRMADAVKQRLNAAVLRKDLVAAAALMEEYADCTAMSRLSLRTMGERIVRLSCNSTATQDRQARAKVLATMQNNGALRPEGLIVPMYRLLFHDDPDGCLEMFDIFKQVYVDTHGLPDNVGSVQILSPGAGGSVELMRRRDIAESGPEAALAALFALDVRNNTQNATLSRVLSTLDPFPIPRWERIAKSLKSRGFPGSFFLLCRDRCARLAIQQVTPSSQQYIAFVSEMFRYKHYHTCAQAYQIGRERSDELTPVFFQVFIVGWLRANDARKAEKVWTDMESHGFAPAQIVWEELLAFSLRRNDSFAIKKVWNDATRRDPNLSRSLRFWGLYIGALVEVGAIDDGIAAFDKMQRDANLKPNVEICNAILRGLTKHKRTDIALTILQKMHSSPNLLPNEVTYNLVLRSIIGGGDWKRASSIFNDMQSKAFRLDVMTFAVFIDHLYRSGTPENKAIATEMLANMSKIGPADTAETYSRIILYLTRFDDEIVSLLEDPERRRLQNVNVAAALDVYNTMLDRGYHPDSDVCSAMLKVHFAAEKPMADESLRMYIRMNSSSVPLGRRGWLALIYGLCHADRMDDALKVFHRMSRSTATPRAATFLQLLTIFNEKTMLEQGQEVLAIMATINPETNDRMAMQIRDQVLLYQQLGGTIPDKMLHANTTEA